MAIERANPFVIDLGRLHEEWQRQPGYSREAGRREAEAKRAVNQCRARLKLIDAQLLLQIRGNPEAHGLGAKPNKEVLEAAVTVHPSYQAAVEALNEALYAQDVAEADRVACCHDRRKALENEVELLCINYHSETEPRPLTEGGQQELKRRGRRDRDADVTE
jgi:hypothetical protein